MFAFGSWQGTAGSQRLELNGCQRGNHRLQLQGTAGSQRLELLVPNLGTTGYHCKELPVACQRLERMVPHLGTRGYHCKQLPVPTWEPQVTIAKNFQFLKVGTDGSQRGNLRLPWQGTAGSQTLKRFPTWEPEVTIARNCRFLEVRIFVFEAKQLSL